MQEFLHYIDPDYYRSALLLIVQAELEQLRQEHLAIADVERRDGIHLAMSAPRARSIGGSREVELH